MQNKILKYISKFVPITKDLEKSILESTNIKSFPKGTILLKEGNVSNECYFILKGCIRCFYIKNGDEKTKEFYTEGQAAMPSSYGKKIPSEQYLECIEKTVASIGTPELEAAMFEKYPQSESATRVMTEIIMANYKDTLAEFKMASPEERYLNLLKNRPDLIQRAPQHQIASYLGIKPESLSRIRKRTMNKMP
jgi:CRP-like cAMP-binding protein